MPDAPVVDRTERPFAKFLDFVKPIWDKLFYIGMMAVYIYLARNKDLWPGKDKWHDWKTNRIGIWFIIFNGFIISFITVAEFQFIFCQLAGLCYMSNAFGQLCCSLWLIMEGMVKCVIYAVIAIPNIAIRPARHSLCFAISGCILAITALEWIKFFYAGCSCKGLCDATEYADVIRERKKRERDMEEGN